LFGRCYAALGANMTVRRRMRGSLVAESSPTLRRTRGRNSEAFAIYAAGAILLFGLETIGHFTSSYVGAGQNDAKLYTWALVWWPHAVSSGINPFLARVVYAPSGANMAWVTGIPGLALLTAPITLSLGPVASSNLLALLAPATTAFGAYVLCQHVTRRFWPSVLGGLLFGFSTYESAQMRGHLDLLFTFPIPLGVYLVLRRLEGTISPKRFVVFFTILLVAEFSVSTEIFATMTMFSGVAIAFSLLFSSRDARANLWHALGWIGVSYGVAGLILAPYLYYALALGVPTIMHSPATAASDLLSYVLPRAGTLVGGSTFRSVTRHFTSRAVGDGAYLGIPLLLIIGLVFVRHRRSPVARTLAATFLVIAVFSLGSLLHIDGHATIPLPWALVTRLPLIGKAIPSRFGMYTSLIAAVAAAVWLAEHRDSVAAWGVVGLSALLLLPNVGLSTWNGPVHVPAFFTQGLYRRYLTPGELVVVIPFRGGTSMLWQAAADMSFRMPFGYVGPKPIGFVASPATKELSTNRPGSVDPSQLLAYLHSHHVQAVLVKSAVASAWRPLLSALHVAPVSVGGIELYRLK
jgi:hypothetical protein